MLSIESIKVAEGTVYLPEDSAEIFKLGYTNTYGGRDYQTNLKVLDLHGFDTSKVTNMESMFSCCYKLTSLDLSGFDTSNVTYMSSMFNGCGSLTTLDLSSFDTSNVTFMGGMFKDCRNLKTLNLSGFDMSNKITTGYTSGAKKGTFGIKENCTRGQIVTFLYRAK